MEKLDCYGKHYNKLTKCAKCDVQIKNYCKSARELPLLSTHSPTFDEIKYAEDYATPAPAASDYPENEERQLPSELYSQADLAEVIAFLMSLDFKTFEILSAKLADPNITFADIAKNKNISRQAIHKTVLDRCGKFPELEEILRNRKRQTTGDSRSKKTTFMEAVCQIRARTKVQHRNKSTQRGGNLNYCMSLISLSRNLDLSRLSLLKGVTQSESS